jgi:catecholate siderophore receptor
VRDIGEYNRDLFATESVDVLKGPSALMFGRGSTGGLINQVSKVADLVAAQGIPHLRLLRAEALHGATSTSPSATRTPFASIGARRELGLVPLSAGRGARRLRAERALQHRLPDRDHASYYYLKTQDVTDYGQPTIPPLVTGDGTFHMPPISPRNYYGYENYDHTSTRPRSAPSRVEHGSTGT